MKRVVMLLAVGALILGPALAAQAQPTVSFGGQMRVHGFVTDNVSDFKDTAPDGKGGQVNKDSNSGYLQRFRLHTTIASQDKKARAHWQLEIGDIVWGNGGGASGGEFCNSGVCGQTAPGATATSGGSRVGNGSGGGFGADGINVETKHAYLWFDTGQWVPGSSLALGIQGVSFLSSPVGAFLDDDGAGIKFNAQFNPVDLEIYAVKVSENTLQNADDNDMYVARLGVNVTKDTRFTVEGMIINTQCLARRRVTTTSPTTVVSTTPGTPVVSGTPSTSTANTGSCISADFGDTFWIGGTVATKVGTINLDGTVVYGQRQVVNAAGSGALEEAGWGLQGSARFPLPGVPLNMWVHGWYTSGDSSRGPGSSSAGPLAAKSDKLPIPIGGSSYPGAPFIAEWLFTAQTLGSPGFGQVQYGDYTGTYGIGTSGSFAVTPAFSVGGGVAYVGASDAAGPYGDNLIEIDGGFRYAFNANLSIQGLAGYMIPDKGDNAWGAAFRTIYLF